MAVSRTTSGFARRAGRYALLTVGAAVSLLPLLWMMSTSLTATGSIFSIPPKLFAQWHWSNYTKTIALFPFWRYFVNSVLITVLATFGTVVSSSLVAFGFARCKFRGRGVMF